jgi:endonuclease/exonuclease/phosphatase family metal-dependent hydrolase
MRNTARVLADLEADVVGVIEAENRPALNEFNRIMIPAIGGATFRHVMVIDGNDERGIDVGLLCREGFAIETMRSHVDDRMANGVEIFSRDCPEYHLTTPNGNRLIVMVNHFKSKGYGTVAGSNVRRKAQAQRVKEIYEGLIAQGAQFIAVAGDLNDTPDSEFVSRNGTCMRNSRTSVMPLRITLRSGWMLIFSFASARVWLAKGENQNLLAGPMNPRAFATCRAFQGGSSFWRQCPADRPGS